MQESGEHGAACANCGAALGGEYCAQCGERRLHPGEHTLRHIVGEWFEAFSHGEGRLLVSLRTLLLRPGELTREYFRGRRVPYTKPVALFFAINLLYFLLTTVNTFGTPMYLQLEIQPLVQAKQVVATKQVFAARLEPTERAAVLDEYLGMFAAIKAKIESGSLPRSGKEAEEQRMIAASRRAPALEALHRYEQRFDERTETLSRALVIALIPMLACFLWLTLAPLRRGLPELLIFATHLLGGLLLILLISGWLITATTLAAQWWMGGRIPALLGNDIYGSMAVAVAVMVYVYLALRVFFRFPRIGCAVLCVWVLAGLFWSLELYRALLFFVTVYALH